MTLNMLGSEVKVVGQRSRSNAGNHILTLQCVVYCLGYRSRLQVKVRVMVMVNVKIQGQSSRKKFHIVRNTL